MELDCGIFFAQLQDRKGGPGVNALGYTGEKLRYTGLSQQTDLFGQHRLQGHAAAGGFIIVPRELIGSVSCERADLICHSHSLKIAASSALIFPFKSNHFYLPYLCRYRYTALSVWLNSSHIIWLLYQP